jgi:pyruvate/2-oxoacid:ferredoxin oxidoreductase beta subunit
MKTFLAPALLAVAAAAHAGPSVKTLAQFDIGYAKCEARFDHMKGRGDEAYLALWKIKPDEKQRAELAKQRSSTRYRDERSKAMKTMAKPSPALDEKLRRQCDATWSELQRADRPVNMATSKPAASAPTAKRAASAATKK